MRLAVLLLVLALLASSAWADPDKDSLANYFNSVSQDAANQGNQFVAGLGQGGQGLTSTVFDAFNATSCDADWVNPAGGVSGIMGMWLAPAIYTAIIVLFGIGIVYILGQFLGSPQLIALAKDELFQTGLTVLRVFFLIGTLTAATTWYVLSAAGSTDPIYSDPANQNMIDAAMAFARMMVSDMSNHYSMLLIYNMVMHTIYSATMWIGVTWRAMYSFNLGPVLRPLIDILGSALQFLSLGISEWLLHIVTLCLIKKWMWGLFIPLGMLLRAFPYTRNAGEALLALSFSLAIFYPFMFIFDYEVHKLMKWNIADPSKAVSTFLQESGILQVFGSVLVAMFLMAGVFMPFFMGGALTIAFELIRGAIYYIVIISIMLPFLNIFVTLTTAKETADFFRTDVNFMSFLKII
ncbi:hypothetical protein H0O00_02620 [Candidatus Micrarchaeota archaeon]|nr:hypothetical protein [Candidatus Micrarchaeota archaeon]